MVLWLADTDFIKTNIKTSNSNQIFAIRKIFNHISKFLNLCNPNPELLCTCSTSNGFVSTRSSKKVIDLGLWVTLREWSRYANG